MREPVIPERHWDEARQSVFERFRAIQMLDKPLERYFDWPPDELIGECAQRLAAEAKVAEQEATIAGLTEALKEARKHRGVWLHDAECFSIKGDKPCVCGREKLVQQIDAALSKQAQP